MEPHLYTHHSCYISTKISLSPILSNSTDIFLHGCVRAHAVEEFDLLAIPLYDFPGALVMTCEHSSHHHKVSPGTCGGKRMVSTAQLHMTQYQ